MLLIIKTFSIPSVALLILLSSCKDQKLQFLKELEIIDQKLIVAEQKFKIESKKYLTDEYVGYTVAKLVPVEDLIAEGDSFNVARYQHADSMLTAYDNNISSLELLIDSLRTRKSYVISKLKYYN